MGMADVGTSCRIGIYLLVLVCVASCVMLSVCPSAAVLVQATLLGKKRKTSKKMKFEKEKKKRKRMAEEIKMFKKLRSKWPLKDHQPAKNPSRLNPDRRQWLRELLSLRRKLCKLKKEEKKLLKLRPSVLKKKKGLRKTRTKKLQSQSLKAFVPVILVLKDSQDEESRTRATKTMNEQFLGVIKGPIRSIEEKKAFCASRAIAASCSGAVGMLSELSEINGGDVSNLQTLGQVNQETQESISKEMKTNSQLKALLQQKREELNVGGGSKTEHEDSCDESVSRKSMAGAMVPLHKGNRDHADRARERV